MSVLIYYPHGLGDCIMFTPQLRVLDDGFEEVHLICRDSVVDSHLFDSCPYVDRLIPTSNPWDGEFIENIEKDRRSFKQRAADYDAAFFIDHLVIPDGWHKVDLNSLKVGIDNQIDPQPEIFIDDVVARRAQQYIDENFPDGYIFKHTDIELHPLHDWEADDWIQRNLPDLPVTDTGHEQPHYRLREDINFTFYLLSQAEYVVLSSSVMVHAADALNKEITVLNKGHRTAYDMPINRDAVRKLRIDGAFVSKDTVYSKLDPPYPFTRSTRAKLGAREAMRRFRYKLGHYV
jgi:hypothetical protein